MDISDPGHTDSFRMSSSLTPYCTLEDLPRELLLDIIRFIDNSGDHLSFSKVCGVACQAYPPKIWQRLCVEAGFGRSLVDKARITWSQLFREVMSHSDICPDLWCYAFHRSGSVIAAGLEADYKDTDYVLAVLAKKAGKDDPPDPPVLHFLFDVRANVPSFSSLRYPYDSTPDGHRLYSTAAAKDDPKHRWRRSFWGDYIIEGVGGGPFCRLFQGWPFACIPPSKHVSVRLDFGRLGSSATHGVENESGVTVHDVISAIDVCLNFNIPLRHRKAHPQAMRYQMTWCHLLDLDNPRRARARAETRIKGFELSTDQSGGLITVFIALADDILPGLVL